MVKVKPKKNIRDIVKFLLVLLVLLAYGLYATYSYGVQQGLSVTLLTWSFFVFATPIADAGFLVAFPIRVITGFRMLYTQIVVWLAAALCVTVYLFLYPEVFSITPLLDLFHKIITTPWPLGLILVLSAIGTFMSVLFDDDVYDVASSSNKKMSLKTSHTKFYYTISIFSATLIIYLWLLSATHISIKLF